jgi:hypothetical protein
VEDIHLAVDRHLQADAQHNPELLVVVRVDQLRALASAHGAAELALPFEEPADLYAKRPRYLL